MKRILAYVIVFSVCCGSMAYGQCFTGCSLPWLGTQCGDLKVKPYAQMGLQHVGSNISLPVAGELVGSALDLQIDTMDLSLNNANFWTGIVGFNATASEKYSLFASAGGDLGHAFITSGTIPVSLNGTGTSANLDFTNSKLETWFVQTGVGVGPVLLGLYWDKFTIGVGDPRDSSGPLPNQTLRGDFVTTTFCPFIGFAMPVSNALISINYSPLAWANTTLALRSSNNGESELQYKWNKPGNLLSTSLQYNQDLTKNSSVGLWATYMWMDQRGTAGLSFEHNGIARITRNKDVTATMTKYMLQGGLTLTITF